MVELDELRDRLWKAIKRCDCSNICWDCERDIEFLAHGRGTPYKGLYDLVMLHKKID